MVNNILWHFSPLGKVCPQLLHRASGEQLAHRPGAQRLLHASRSERHPTGRQRRYYQRVYLGILGKGMWGRMWRCRRGQELRTERREMMALEQGDPQLLQTNFCFTAWSTPPTSPLDHPGLWSSWQAPEHGHHQTEDRRSRFPVCVIESKHAGGGEVCWGIARH